MKEWLLGVVATILFTTILSLILPDGKTLNLIKNIFGILSILVVINPLFKIDEIISPREFVFGDKEIVLDNNYLDYVYGKKLKILEENSLKIIEEYYSKGATIVIECNKDNLLEVEVNKISIDLSNCKLIANGEKNTYIDKIVNQLSAYLCLEENKIIINE